MNESEEKENGRVIVDWKRYTSEFPITKEKAYLNNAAVGALSTRNIDAINRTARIISSKGTGGDLEILETVASAREALARLLGASADEIAFTKNTTQGVLIVANGIPLNDGDNIVLPSIEFPANVYPWLALKNRGIEVREIEPVDGKVTSEMLIESCDERTKAVTVSAVQFSSGYRIDMEKLGAFCRKNGIYLHVDGIQAIGMIDFDVKRFNVDFLSSGAHKWLLGVGGIGFLYIRRELIDRLDVWNPGWLSVENPMDFANHSQGFRANASRFEEGSLNAIGIAALGASVERFLEIGIENIERRIISTTDALEEGLRERGFKITSPRGERERSGIICFRNDDIPSETIFDRLTARRVATSLRLGNIRVSPHFYNDETDVKRFFEAIDSIE